MFVLNEAPPARFAHRVSDPNHSSKMEWVGKASIKYVLANSFVYFFVGLAL